VVVVFALSGVLAWAVDWVPDERPPSQGPSVQPTESQPARQPGELITWEKSLDTALERARKENKPVLIDFYVTWQQWCQTLDDKTLADPAIVQLSRRFVCARVNGKDSPDVVKKYGVRGYPTVVFLNPRGEVVHRVIGFVPARPFELEMKPVAEGRNPEKEFQKLVDSKPREFRPLVLLGIGYAKREQWDKAIAAYDRALDIGPGLESKETHEVIYSLCQLYDYKKQPEKSEELLLKILEVRDSDKVKVHDMLGQTYLSLKQPEKAIEQFEAERALVADEQHRQFIDQMIERIRSAGK
jgi:tetratricopeptide (TPR) repeat protein